MYRRLRSKSVHFWGTCKKENHCAVTTSVKKTCLVAGQIGI